MPTEKTTEIDTRNTTESFPFKTTLTLKKLIEFWDFASEGEECMFTAFANEIRKALDKVPELSKPITDLSLIEKHRSVVDALMSPVFAPASWDTDISAAILPFSFQQFYATPAFERTKFFYDGKLLSRMNFDEQTLRTGSAVSAYLVILRRFYGIEVNLENAIIGTVSDPKTGLDRHYKWRFDPRFADVINVGGLPELSEADKKRLYQNPFDLDEWFRLLPPHHFEFHGFTVFNAIDVSDQEVVSQLKYDLIERDILISTAGFNSVQEKLRTLFRRPDLQLGLASLPSEHHTMFDYGQEVVHSFVLDDACRTECTGEEESAFRQMLARGEVTIIDDLAVKNDRNAMYEGILEQGVRNLLIAPLLYQGQVLGILELGSKNPGDINGVNALKLKEVLPLFSTAIRRSMEEMNNRVQAVIKEKCTAIHPSVEWRFRNAAITLLQNAANGQTAEMEEIVFHDVYPLYGLSDIRESSSRRNKAIQTDLIDQLQMALDIASLASTVRPLPYLDELCHRIQKHINNIQEGLGSGDETGIIYFLRSEVESLFATLQDFHPKVKNKINAYTSAIDPQHGILYRMRKDFESSVTMLNEAISSYIDEEQQAAQSMFPHYFEKYKTDGVEHGMYAGGSLAEDGKFDALYLKNLRLWQLMVMCGVARTSHALYGTLPMPLETAHLILVQDTPLSIRFRLDEKKFDVDGSYNIRYEIMKKRIDKATVRGRTERLTQPGKIAIVYSQTREALEYRKYLDYLQAKGYIGGDIEEMELEDLQGIQGLKALRVSVKIAAAGVDMHGIPDEIHNAVKALTDTALGSPKS
ncbi:MAG: GAF domain-containing protein [Bacteroidota bacterium]